MPEGSPLNLELELSSVYTTILNMLKIMSNYASPKDGITKLTIFFMLVSYTNKWHSY